MTCEGCVHLHKGEMGTDGALEFWWCDRHPRRERRTVVYDRRVVNRDKVPAWCEGKVKA